MQNNINVIFHHPLPLNENATSASGIRPIQMIKAFKALGCEVDLVTGYAEERKQCMLKIKENIMKGKRYDFVYAESSTMPTILTEPSHLPSHPFLDWRFFTFCNNNNIPIGLFYRDIYWLFETYGNDLNAIKKNVAKLSYRFDLWVYNRTLTKLYLPSMAMGNYVPGVNPQIFEPLPPGHVFSEQKFVSEPEIEKTKLKLFYVGGMSEHYQMHKLFAAVQDLSMIELTICTREKEWLSVRNEYPTLTPNIRVVHLSGEEMESELNTSDIALLFVEPHEYRDFAAPVKLYEYLGNHKPIIASEGTLAGQFVSENGIGWTVPYDVNKLKELLVALFNDSQNYNDIIHNISRVASEHSWESRAAQVIKGLSK